MGGLPRDRPLHLRLRRRAAGIARQNRDAGFGLRHAVDADDIAAIDNTTRKLMPVSATPSLRCLR
ncbi:MAG TPA: hypothetical protein VN632_07915 [Stellaceae bacterium]|nr:hypothetical protein [Stellaceae bacterium]